MENCSQSILQISPRSFAGENKRQASCDIIFIHSLSSLSLSSLSPTPNSISISGLRAKENGAGGAGFCSVCLTSFDSCLLGRPGMGSPGFQPFGIGGNRFNRSPSMPLGMESGFVLSPAGFRDGFWSTVASGI